MQKVEPGPPADLEAQNRPVPKHPIATFFHVGFKAAALLAYMFLWIFNDSFVVNFLTIILLSAADFWTTKNVTGRLMVGLRWWHQVREDGSEEWQFESLEDKTLLSQTEVYIFWGALLGAPFLWCFFAIGLIFRFKVDWLVVLAVVIAMLVPNIVGYWKCARESKARLEAYAQGQASSYVTSTLMNYAMGGANAKK